MASSSDPKCPCGNIMEIKLAEGHYHCSCGICIFRGKQLTWFKQKEETYRPDRWTKDIFFKTGGLS